MGSRFRQVVSGYRKVRLFSIFISALLLGASGIPAMAQSYLQNIGVPSFTTKLPVENGFINAANGNLHLEIPLGSFPQRAGSPDKIVMMYDSAIWTTAGGSWQPTNVTDSFGGNNALGGWRVVTSREAGFFTDGQTESGYCTQMNDYYWVTYSPWIWVAPDGTQHSFSASTTAPLYSTVCPGTGTPASTAYATDGSGYYISITNYTNAIVYAPDGSKLTYNNLCNTALGGCSTTPATEDTNGNYTPAVVFSYNSTTNTETITHTDTLGRTLLTEQYTYGTYVQTYKVPSAQGTSTYTVTMQTISVCPVGCTSSSSFNVISEIDLPDGTKYTFSYDSGTTPGHYGLLTQTTFPSGGSVQYSYAVQTDAMGNPYNWIKTRTTPDGTWNYGFQTLNTCASGYVNCQQKFTVTKPSNDQTVYTFTLNGGDWPTAVQYYTGSTTSGTLLAGTTQCFNFVTVTAGSCSYSVTGPVAAATNVHLLATTTTLPIPNSGNVNATTEYAWDAYGNQTSIQEWNFGNSPSNAADRTTSISYLTGTAYQPPNANIVNRPTNITVTNKAGTTVAQTLYGYDVYTYNGGSLAGVTASGHDTNYGTNITARGNVTLIQNLISGSTYLNSYRNFDTTGQVTNAFDPNNQKTANAYTCQNAYPNTITNPLTQVTQIGYDCNTGLVTSIQDPNNVANSQSTSISYDNMFRPTTIGYPDGGQTTLAYNYSGSTLTGSTTTQKVSSTQNLVTTNTTDGLGRVTSSVMTSDPDGNTTVTTSFDTNSRVQSVSNPYRGTLNGSESYVYDGLDRVTQITHVDGHISSVYYGPSVGSQGGAATQLCAPGTYNAGYPILKIDEANNKLQSWIDGLGRTIEADEPTATSASLTANTCYGYDANNNLIGVLAAGGLQTRSYGYDGVSRLKSKADPESGTTTYTWDSSTMCGAGSYTSNGDLVNITDAAGHCLNRYFDALHRLTDVGSSSGCQRFRYDNTNGVLGSKPSGLTISNPLGRLVEAETDTCAALPASMITDQWSSYDPMGRVTLNTQCTPVLNCGTSYWSLNYGYDLLGDTTSYTNGAGVTFTQSFSGAGRLSSVTSNYSDANHPGTLLSGVHYNALGEPSSGTLGNGAVETLTYAPRGWPLTASVQSQSTGTPGTGTVTINGSEQSYTNPPVNTSAGPNGVGAGASQSGNNIAWTNPNNITLNNPSNAASAVGPYGAGKLSNYLLASSFGFNLPASTTSINGIQVKISKYQSAYLTGNVLDSSVLLRNGSGALVGTNHALSGYWVQFSPGSTYTYGSSTDTWGASLSLSDINSSNFGVGLSADLFSARYHNVIAEVSYVTITVWYTYQNGPTYDSGSVTVTVNGTSTPPASYSNGSTGASIASQLASSISAFGFVTASTGGTNVITITSTTNGLGTNYSLSASSQSSAGFNPASFTTALSNVAPCGSATCMTGGTGAPGTLYSFSLGYGAGNANVTTANDNINGTWAFTYDYLNRLSTANQNNGQNICSFGYDQLGNRTSQTATAGSCNGNLSLTYAGNNNRMDGYSYDAAGNLLSDTVHTYAYDAWNRLITVDGGNTATYVYDALGRRVQRTGQFEYLYDLNGSIVTYLNPAGAWVLGEIFANGQHLATYSGCGTTATTYFDHADWLGTERDRSNMADANSESITSLPFGDLQFTSGSCGDPSPQHFTGQQRDSESGLHYFGARHYSTQFGRFMSPDPTGIFLGNLNDPQSLNLYSYVRNNPTSFTDPSGLQCDEFDSSGCGCDFFCISLPIGIGGGGGGGIGPQPPIYFPPNVGSSPNPNGSASNDPFSGETNGIPNGLRVPTLGLPGLLMPSSPGCDFGACGGGNGFTGAIALEIGAGAVCAGSGVCEAIVTGGLILGTVAEIAYLLRPIFQSKKQTGTPANAPKPPANPADPPGPGWEWRGSGPPGSSQGSWYNPSTGESLHPDLGHADPIGPHWDYTDPAGKTWRIPI